VDPGTPKKRDGRLELDRDDDPTQLVHTPVPRETRATDSLDAPTGQTSIDVFDLAPGAMLGEYRIEQKIGEGGMGVVFSAVHPLIGKRAAIKVLKRELCEDPYSVERFQDEARVVNEIGHPNIVDVFAFGEMPGGRRYFVMEWLRGESLRERIARQRTPLAAICAILRPLARALEAAHEKGIIHRDLKPDNIFLVETREGEPTVKLLDFGIAKLARTNAPRLERTATGAMVGTPMYIAPEQARGHAIDHRVDIYSLGAIAFELLTGRTPFIADNAMEMVAKHLMEPPPTVASVWPNVPPALDEIVTRMLAKDANERPSLAQLCAVLDEVKTWDVTLPPRARRAAVAARTVRQPRAPARGRRVLLLGVAVVAIAVAAYVVVPRSETARVPVEAAPVAVATADAAPVAVAVDAFVPEALPEVVVDAAVPVPAKLPDRPRPTRSTLTIRVANADAAEIRVDGAHGGSISNGEGEVGLMPGVHHLEVRGSDGTSVTFTVTMKQARMTKTIAFPVKKLDCSVHDDGLMNPGCIHR